MALLSETIEALPTDVLKHVLFKYLEPADLVKYNDVCIFKYSLCRKDDLEISLAAASIDANNILREMVPHINNGIRYLMAFLISRGNEEILRLVDPVYFSHYHLDTCVIHNKLSILTFISSLLSSEVLTKKINALIRLCIRSTENSTDNRFTLFEYLLSVYINIVENRKNDKTKELEYYLKDYFRECRYIKDTRFARLIIDVYPTQKGLNINNILNNEHLDTREALDMLKYMFENKKGHGNHRSLKYSLPHNLEVFEYVHLLFTCPCDVDTLKQAMLEEMKGADDDRYQMIDYILDHRLNFGYFEDLKRYCSNRVWSLLDSVRNKQTEGERVAMLCGMIKNEAVARRCKRLASVNSVVHWAICEGEYDILELAHDEYMPVSLGSMMYIACKYNQPKIVRFLHTMRIDLNKDDIWHGYWEAKNKGHTEITEYLEQFL